MNKPILCVDFDGVIHSYESGWKGATAIPDLPVEGAIAFLREALEVFDVHIYSSRSHQEGGIAAMQHWLLAYADNDEDMVLTRIQWPNHKPSAMITIDDRALTFDGTWPAIADLRNFKPWNKR